MSLVLILLDFDGPLRRILPLKISLYFRRARTLGFLETVEKGEFVAYLFWQELMTSLPFLGKIRRSRSARDLVQDTFVAIQELRDMGFALGIVTNRKAGILERHMRRLGILKYWFKVIVNGKGRQNDSKGVLFDTALKQTGLSERPAQALFVTDSIKHYREAVALGMQSIVVCTGDLDSADFQRLSVPEIDIFQFLREFSLYAKEQLGGKDE